MSKARDLTGQMEVLVKSLFTCLRQTMPSKQYRAELILAAIHLELLRRNLVQATGLEEWRIMANELTRGMDILRKGIEALWQTCPKKMKEERANLKPTERHAV